MPRTFPTEIDIFDSPTHVQKGRLLQWKGTEFQWLPVERIVGHLGTAQEACPCVYANLYALDAAGQVQGRYEEATRWTFWAALTLRDDNDQWWRLEYDDGHLTSVSTCAIPSCTFTALNVSDAAGLIHD